MWLGLRRVFCRMRMTVKRSPLHDSLRRVFVLRIALIAPRTQDTEPVVESNRAVPSPAQRHR